MASWTLKSSGSDINSAGATPRTVTLPSNASGELMILFVQPFDGTTAAAVAVTTSGWTEIAKPSTQTTSGTQHNRVTCFAKISAGSEASAVYTETNAVYTEGLVVVLTPSTSAATIVLDTPDTTPNPSIGHVAGTSATATLDASLSVGAITDALLVCTGGFNTHASSTGSPVTLTKIFGTDVDGVSNVYWKTDLASTTVGSESFSWASADLWYLLAVAFPLTAGGGGGFTPVDRRTLHGYGNRPGQRQLRAV